MIQTRKKANVSKDIRFFFFFIFVSAVLFSCGKPHRLPPVSDAGKEEPADLGETSENLKILLISSNAAVGKYKAAQEAFRKTVSNPVMTVNMGSETGGNIDMGRLLSYNADLIYCIGGKAYFFAREHFGEKKIVFSSIINWLRLPGLDGPTYGVSNELHPRMPIYMFRSLFPSIKRIGMIYSTQYTLQWFENAKGQAGELEIEIIGKTVSQEKQTLSALDELLPNIDALWLISDPLVMSKKEYLYKILERCDARNTPVFSYHGPFAKLGAAMIVSADIPTIGRQAANIAMGVLSGEEIDEKVQFPAGSHIVLNMKKVKKFGLKYNKDALGLINTIIK